MLTGLRQLLLFRTEDIPMETKEALTGIEHTLVVGGPAVISVNVESSLPQPVRIAGANRYETAVELIRRLNLPTQKVFVAAL